MSLRKGSFGVFSWFLSFLICVPQQLLYARQQVPAPVDDLIKKLEMKHTVCESLDGVTLRRSMFINTLTVNEVQLLAGQNKA